MFFLFASRKGVCIYSCFPRGRLPCSSSFFFFFFLRAEEKNQRKSIFLELFENTVLFLYFTNSNCRFGASFFGVRGRAGRWKSSPPRAKTRDCCHFSLNFNPEINENLYFFKRRVFYAFPLSILRFGASLLGVPGTPLNHENDNFM